MSHNNPAASRKRRSSILKSKPRAPFAELEFNPPTPDAASKSRRVSFSRKTGVAEFAMNEATTTWKNFYEEQNRTLESSGNDSELHKPSTANRSVHQPFHEVEAEINHTTLGNPRVKPGANLTLFNDMDFTEQFANLESCDNPARAPVKKLEMSVMGQTNNIFTNSFQIPLITEHTGRIEVDFSMTQSTPQNQEDLGDDLSDIAKDVERSNPNIIGQNIFMKEFNQSCYVEVDLNETKGIVRSDFSDMSITDTIQSPNVQAPPKSKQIGLDWAMDKENIVVDSFPISASGNVGRSEENVLVFDGKKLKLANINDKLDDILNEPLTERNTLNRPKSNKFDSTSLTLISADILRCGSKHICTENVSEVSITLSQDTNTHQHSIHKSVSHQMSVMPDMSLTDNYIENPSINITNKILGINMIEKAFNTNPSMAIELTEENPVSDVRSKPKLARQQKTYTEYASNEMSIHSNTDIATKITPILCQDKLVEAPKRKTIILNQDDDLPNFTLDIPPQFDQRALKGFQEDVVFDTEESIANMSTTQAILREIEETSGLFQNTIPSKPTIGQEQRQTIVFDEAANMSVTQAVLTIPIAQSKRQTIVFDKENDNANMSISQAIPSKSAKGKEKRQTIVFETQDEAANMSVTQAIPINAIVQSKRQTIIFDNETDIANMSITQAIPSKSAMGQGKRQTIVFDTQDEAANMSVTQAIPTNAIVQSKRQTIIFDNETDIANMSMTQAIPSKSAMGQGKRQTIVFDTQDEAANMSVTQAIPINAIVQSKRQTIVFDKENDNANMSITQAIPSKSAMGQEKRQTIVFETQDEAANMSATQAIPTNAIVQSKRQTIIFDNETDIANMSMTQAIPSKSAMGQGKRQTIVFDTQDEAANMSVTQAIPTNAIVQSKRQTIIFDNETDIANMSMTQAIPSKSAMGQGKRKTIVFDTQDEAANMSVTQAIPTNSIVQSKRQTIVFDKENDNANMSITQAIPSKSAMGQEKRQTIVFETQDEAANMSATQAIPTIPIVQSRRQTIVFDKENDNANMSITQAILSKPAMYQEMGQTIVFDTQNVEANMSVTQPIPIINGVAQSKRQTIVFDKENDNANMSITQAIPSKPIIDRQKRQTIVFEDSDMSMTQAIPSKCIDRQKRHTMVFDKENDNANISVTQAIPSKPYIVQQKRQTINFDNANMSITQGVPTMHHAVENKRPILFSNKETDEANMPKTQTVSTKSHCISEKENYNANMLLNQPVQKVTDESNKKRQTGFNHHDDLDDISLTRAVASAKSVPNDKWRATLFEQMDEIPVIRVPIENNESPVFKNELLIIQDPHKITAEKKLNNMFYATEKAQESKIYDNSIHMTDKSNTQPMPVILGSEEKHKTINKNYATTSTLIDNILPHATVNEENRETILYDIIGKKSEPCLIVNEQKRKTVIFDKNNVTMNPLLNESKAHMIVSEEKRKTLVFSKDTDLINTVTQSLSKNLPSEEQSKSINENYISKTNELLKMSKEIKTTLECDTNTSKHHKIDSSILKNQELQKTISTQKCNPESEHFVKEYDLEKESNTDILMQTNKSVIEKSKVNHTLNNKKKSLLAQMLGDSENSLDLLYGKACDADAENKDILVQTVKETIVCHDEITDKDKLEKMIGQRNDLIENVQNPKTINQNTINLEKRSCVEQNKNDDSMKTKSQLVSQKHEILQELDDTNYIIDMLTEATDQIEQNQMESACKGEPTHKQKIMTNDYLERMITDLDKEQNDKEIIVKPLEKKEEVTMQIEDTTQNAKDNGTESRLPIPILLNQSERIKSLNITMNKRPSWDNIMQEDFKNCETNMEKPHTRISTEVVKTLNFEEDSFDRPEQINISVTRNYNEKFKSMNQERLSKDAGNISTGKDFSITNFDPPMCSTQRFSIKSGDLDAFMNKNKPDKTDKREYVDKTYDVAQNTDKSVIFTRPADGKNTTYQVTKHHIEKDNSAMSISTRGNGHNHKSADSVTEKGANTNISNKISEEMLDNTSCITLVDDSMDGNAAEFVEDKLNTEAVTKQTHDINKSIANATINNHNETESKVANSLLKPETCDTQGRKRSLSPSKQYQCNMDVTPKPPTKIHKFSNVSDDRDPMGQPIVNEKHITLDPEYICQKDNTFKRAICLEKETQYQRIASVSENEKEELEVIIDLTTDKVKKFNNFGEIEKLAPHIDINDDDHKKVPSQIGIGQHEHQMDLGKQEHNQITSEIALAQLEHNKITSKIDLAHQEHNNSEIDHVQLEHNKITSECYLAQLEHNTITSEIDHGRQEHDEISSQMKVGKSKRNVIASQSDLNENMSMREKVPKEKKDRDSLFIIEEFKNQVVDDIDKLPFMGTWCLQWEQCCDSEWSFLLLYSRVRLCVKLAETERACVHADTKIRAVEVEEVHSNSSSAVAAHATSSCLASLRALAATSECARAADVRALLTLCASVTAKADKWARDMSRAKLHLAYKLNGDALTLNVANVPLRSVWQISLRVVYEAGGPRACDVHVGSVCSDVQISRTDVEAVLQDVGEGWGNVPCTVWKVFKYLKHKTKDDDLRTLLRLQ